jgi:hypothetical protein
MGQLFPHLRDIEDFNHKLWDHLHIMSGFRLEVVPTRSPTKSIFKANRSPCPTRIIKFVLGTTVITWNR